MVQKRRINAHEKRVVAARQEWKCFYCNKMLDSTFEVDHIVPLHKGGADNHVTNAGAACRTCHGKKTQLEEIERLKSIQKAGMSRRPALSCTRCLCIISPYFSHRCT